MNFLLSVSRLIDALNERIGRAIYWLILVAVLVSAGNAIVRYAFNRSSNAWLEIQWYLFSAVFLFCAGYTLLHNQHVRIDVIAGRLSKRAQAWIDVFGTLLFLLPMAITIMWLSWPVFVDAYRSHEISTNAGGLTVWPARLMVPAGFFLLVAQGISELIKRIAYLRGLIPDPTDKDEGPSLEEQLAATSGVVAASVISMGLISLPIMLRYGYDRRFATGVIAASGTLAQIIPPSLVLIIMADQLGRSVGDMYEGAFIPGLTLAGLYAVYALGITLVKPAWAPALPQEARTLREPDGTSGTRSLVVLVLVATAAAIGFAKYKYGPDGPTDEMLVVSTAVGVGVAFAASVINHFAKLGLLSRIAERVTFVLIPPLALIFLVLGTIFLVVATPTEGGAMGASGALAMALARRRLSVKLLKQAMDTTAKLTAS